MLKSKAAEQEWPPQAARSPGDSITFRRLKLSVSAVPDQPDVKKLADRQPLRHPESRQPLLTATVSQYLATIWPPKLASERNAGSRR